MCPQIRQDLVINVKVSMAMGVEHNVVEGVASTPSSPMVTMTNASHHVKVIQKSNGLIPKLFFPMTVTLLLPMVFVRNINTKGCVDANRLNNEDVGVYIFIFFDAYVGASGLAIPSCNIGRIRVLCPTE